MDTDNIKTYRINQTGKTKEMICDSNGEWIRKSDFDYILNQFKDYKKDWNLDNASLQMARVIDELNLDSNKTFALHMLSSSMMLSMAAIKESNINDTRSVIIE